LGDGGFMWPHNNKGDAQNYEILAQRHFPILCVVGNHEPIYGMKNIPEIDIGIGETVCQITTRPFIAYLKRGKAYTIDGIKFLVLGGALSIDRYNRVPNKTWWELEYWTEQEKQDVFKLLETDNHFDFVISNTGPNRINRKVFEDNHWISTDKYRDKVARLNDEIHGRIQFLEWWCGHFHEDEYCFSETKKHGYQYLYKTTRILEKAGGKFAVHNGCGDVERQYQEELKA